MLCTTKNRPVTARTVHRSAGPRPGPVPVTTLTRRGPRAAVHPMAHRHGASSVGNKVASLPTSNVPYHCHQVEGRVGPRVQPGQGGAAAPAARS
jgi:hypothetical protein